MAGSGARKLTRAERKKRVVELARDGATYREIAKELEISVGTAYNDVAEAVAALPRAAAEERREVEDARLEWLWEKLRKALGDEQGAEDVPKLVDTARKLSESRRKLHGLDAPQQIAGDVTVHYTLNGVDPGDLT